MQFTEEYFDMGLDRNNTRCEKWDEIRAEHGAHVLPMWVADMDFPSPPAATQALLYRAAHPTYGYTAVTKEDYDALIHYWQRHHHLTFTQEDVTLIPCVVTGLKVCIRALTKPGDKVIIQSPVYGPFGASINATERTIVDCPMTCDGQGRYSMNLPAIEAALQDGATMMLLCNPHNPVSRRWDKEELEALMALLRRYNAVLVSDEIHADFVYDAPFVPALSLHSEGVVMLAAASKTFNLAGLQQSACICPDEALRSAIRKEINACGVVSGNLMALDATRAAYNEGDEWLSGLMNYLSGSRQVLTDLVKQYLPKAVLTPMEATYLGWLDLRAYGFTCEELAKRTLAAGVHFTAGTFFGQETGEGFLRINIGCPRRYLEEGIQRLAKALDA